MALRSVMASKIPMVIILGATGTGKTKLSVELAQRFQTEIISADSMQVYKGLDVVTAKATPAERALAPHHLLDILEPHQNFTVVDFRNRALKIIQELTEKENIPIVVGGTNYYMESIIYNILVEEETDSEELLWNRSTIKRDIDDAGPSADEPNAKRPAKDVNNEETTVESNNDDSQTKPQIEITDEIDKEKVKYEVDNERLLTNEDIHLRLMSIDPVMAERLHPNNRRKMLRSIEVWLKTGRRHSDILEEQKQREGCLRRPGATIVLWLKCEQKVHDERLDKRVDGMLEQGLIDELLDFHQRHNKQRLKDGKPPDYTRGIFQTLGFKEFHDYLMLSEAERQGRHDLLQQSIVNMKIGTRRYARRQNKMVKGRFLEHPNREVPPIYELDTTDVSAWDTQVKEKAIDIIESYLNGTPCKYEPLTSETKEAKKDINPFSNNYCEVCKRILIGDKEYGIHLNSNKHMKVLKKRKLEEKKKLESQTDSDNVNV
ncbi:tRNA dimethylallyltransferase [Cydia fagiglandana]|uniref:tRNA dimethylallyltransferase n=1 Tax=Cydia fagiglandana TaxID=1458189 RepID=UPI002FEE38C8